MKSLFCILTCAGVAMLAGCASTPHVNTAVGPDPYQPASTSSEGRLEVFTTSPGISRVESAKKQRAEYFVYDNDDTQVEHVVTRTHGQYQAPQVFFLPPGDYHVKARSAITDKHWLSIPVIVDPGRVTALHLNGKWRPPGETTVNTLVFAPSGYPLGYAPGILPPPQG